MHGTAEQHREHSSSSELDSTLLAVLAGLTDGVTVQDRNGALLYANDAAVRMCGFSTASELFATPIDELLARFEAVDEHGQPFSPSSMPGRRVLEGEPSAEALMRIRAGDEGSESHRLVRSYPVANDRTGELVVVNTFQDVTAQKRAEESVKREARIASALRRIAEAVTTHLDHQETVQRLTDAATREVGAEFGAFFWNGRSESGEEYLLYTLSGAPREAFSKFPAPRATKIFGPTFRGEALIRLDDVRRDPRFGQNPPYNGMPPGHLPVVSYLAAPVKGADGKVLGGLFFGHSKPAVFGEEEEKIINGACGHAAIAIDNARLFEATRAAESQLRRQLAYSAALTDSLGEGVVATDLDGRVSRINPAATALLGIDSEALGRGHGEVIHFRYVDGRDAPSPLDRVLRERVTVRGRDGVIRSATGAERLVAYCAVPKVSEGEVLGAIVTFDDITDRVTAEEERKRSEREQFQRERAEESRRQIEAILNSIADPFLSFDQQWRFSWVNREAEGLTGRKAEELLGRCLWDEYPQLRGSDIERTYRDVREQGRPNVLEVFDEARNRWYELHAYPFGEGLSVYARDVTEQHAAEELKATEAKHAQLRADIGAALARRGNERSILQECCEAMVAHLDAAFARVWTVDRTGAVLELQASAGLYSHLDGAHARVPIGALMIGLVARERRPYRTNDVPNDPRVGDPDWARREGMVSFAGHPLVASGELVGVMGIFGRNPMGEDVLGALGSVAASMALGVQRGRAEQALEERAKELARSNEELERFAYVASHDLQEPLRMVASYTQLLQRRYEGRLDSEADEFIGYAVEGATRMQQLINDLLAYSRVGRGGNLQRVAMERVLERVLANLRRTIDESGAVVTHDLLPELQADPTLMGQLLQNLVSNGIKFRKPGSAPHVHLSAARDGALWHFTVSDDGIGIDPAYFERIFVIFQRLHGRHEYPGTGIGLALCKKIVERHGGTIWIDSAPGRGTTMHFTLPAAGIN